MTTIAVSWTLFNAAQTFSTYIQTKSPSWMATAYKMRHGINLLNIIGSIAVGIAFIPAIDRKRHWIQLMDSHPQLALFSIILSAGVWAYLTIQSVKLINAQLKTTLPLAAYQERFLKKIPQDKPNGRISPAVVNENENGKNKGPETVKIESVPSSYQEVMQTLHFSSLVQSVALLFMKQKAWIFAINSLLLLYNLVKITKWKWIKIDLTFLVNDRSDFSLKLISTTFSFTFFVMPKASGICSNCQEKKEWIHVHSSSCLSCLINHFYEKSKTCQILHKNDPSRAAEKVIRFVPLEKRNEHNQITNIYFQFMIPNSCFLSCIPSPESMSASTVYTYKAVKNTRPAIISFI